jgi:hypothetical protein
MTQNPSKPRSLEDSLSLTRTFRVAADNLNTVGVDLVRVVELEVYVFDDECPDIVAEAVGIEMSLRARKLATQAAAICATATHLERQPRLDLIRQYVRYRFVEVRENLHRKLGLDSALGDEVVQRVREGAAYTASCQPRCSLSAPKSAQYLLRRYSS